MYHRVLPQDDPRYLEEEPGMLVTPNTLLNHIRWLRERFTLVRLEQWLDDARSGGTLPRRAVALTFDDGWRDNFEYALPVLMQEDAPATLFVATDFIGTKRTFWPNRLHRVLRDPRVRSCSSEAAEWFRQKLQVSSSSSEGIAAAIARAKAFADSEIVARLDYVEKKWMLEGEERSILDWLEIEKMVSSGYVDIGSHGCSHLRLRKGLGREQLLQEIVESKQTIHREVGVQAKVFCYPNGDYTAEAEALVAAHYLSAVTTRRGSNTARTPPFELRRVAVHEDITRERSAFFARLGGL